MGGMGMGGYSLHFSSDRRLATDDTEGRQDYDVYRTTSREVFTEVEVEDFAVGTVTLENGGVLQITTSMVAASEQAVTMEVTQGQKGPQAENVIAE